MVGLAFSERIGVSTLCLRGIPLTEAIERTLEAGFSVFEVTPITYGGPEAFGAAEREDLRRRLSAFRLVTVHSSGMGGANICSGDMDHRAWSQNRYLALVAFARDVGADVLTFHPGRAEAGGLPEEAVRAENVAFGKILVDAAGDTEMAMGYELFDARVAREIGGANFGVLFDLGHASCRGPDVDTDDVLGMMDGLAEQTVQFHVHGVGGADKTDHLPFSQNTHLDYGRVVRHIKGLGFGGPLIFEIGIRDEDWQRNLRDCASAREMLVRE